MLPRALVVFVCFLFAGGVPVATFGVPIVLPGSPAPSTPETPLETKLRAGHEALNKNELSKAAAAFGEAHKLDPKSLSPLFGLAEVARLKKDGKGAESWLRKVLSIAPDRAQVHQAWGRYHWSARAMAWDWLWRFRVKPSRRQPNSNKRQSSCPGTRCRFRPAGDSM
ncbi:MAG: tetratricopeptide repeat protein [Pseudomonadota bacterium]